MNTLIVTSHPDQNSLTAAIARQLLETLQPRPTVVADLAAEGFDPRFGIADRESYRGNHKAPADVISEQNRLDAADHVVLVFPVYWWSMPALLKGWIDRVFINGWAFDVDPEAGTRRNLTKITFHVLAVAGDTAGTYERHGYEQALRTQIEHGIVDYVGAQRGSMTFVYESEQDDSEARQALIEDAVKKTARSVQKKD